MTQQTKIDRLRIEEISGVDDPANQAPGWMVQKSRAHRQAFLDRVKAILVAPRHIDAPSDETLRKSVEMFGFIPTLLIMDGSVEVAKARHDVRGPDGVFQPHEVVTGPIPVRHSGNVHPAIRKLFAEQRRNP